jgi:hypothetical protein
MDDTQITAEIEQLEEEEGSLRLEEASAAEAAKPELLEKDRARLEEIRVRLAQLWDLQRQRTALRNAGGDPDDASLRDPGTVENYLG